MWTYQTFQGEGCRKMYGYQGKAVRAGSAQRAVKVFSAGRWRLFRARAGATTADNLSVVSYAAVPRGRGRDSGSSRRLTIPRRLEACKQLGWTTITAIVLDYSAANDDATAELLAELAEIDENLKRNDLTELQQGIQHAQRKRIYEKLHPETKRGALGGKGINADILTDKLSVRTDNYAADAATATGETERTVRRKNLIGEQLESVAEQLTGTAGAIAKHIAAGSATDKMSVAGYAADAATATGETERTVRRKNLIGEQLESVAEQLTGTGC